MREKFNPDMHKIRISPIVRITEDVKEKVPEFERTTGEKFILFQRGDLDFRTPAEITEAIKRALDDGKTKYPKTGGELEPKKAVLRKLEEHNRISGLGLENMIMTYGGQEALQLSFHLFRRERVAGFSPVWSLILENLVPYSNISFSEVPLNKDFSVNYSALERTLKNSEAFYLNNPHNPTGKIFKEEELAKIGELCKKYNVFILSDEAYEHIVFDGKTHVSTASLPELRDYKDIITTFTFSKTFAMTGLRLGYAVTRNKVAADLIKRGDYTQTAAVVTAVQDAALTAFLPSTMEEVKKRVNELQKRRDSLFEGLREVKDIKITKPEGAFYFFPEFSKFIPENLNGKGREWYIYNLFLENGIAIVPGCCFSKENYFPDSARLSISATPSEQIIDATKRMKSFLGSV